MLFFLLLLAPAPAARACPVCFGESDSREDSGTRWAAVLLGGVPYALIGGGAVLAVRQRRRAGRPEGTEEAG